MKTFKTVLLILLTIMLVVCILALFDVIPNTNMLILGINAVALLGLILILAVPGLRKK